MKVNLLFVIIFIVLKVTFLGGSLLDIMKEKGPYKEADIAFIMKELLSVSLYALTSLP